MPPQEQSKSQEQQAAAPAQPVTQQDQSINPPQKTKAAQVEPEAVKAPPAPVPEPVSPVKSETATAASESPVEKPKAESAPKAKRESKTRTAASEPATKDTSPTAKKDANVAKTDKSAAKPADALTKTETTPADAPPAAPDDGSAALAAELRVRTALAQDKFSLLDANGDTFVDRQEASNSVALKAKFAKFDADKDGKLSLEEFAAINDLAAIKMDKNLATKLH